MQHRRQQHQNQPFKHDEHSIRSPTTEASSTCTILSDSNQHDDDEDHRKRRKLHPPEAVSSVRRRRIYGTIAISTGMLLMGYVVIRNQHKYMTVLSWLRIIVLFPIYLCAYTTVRHIRRLLVKQSNDICHSSPQQQQQQEHQQEQIKKILMPLTLIITILSAQLPPSVAAAIATTCIITFSIITRPALEIPTATATTGTHSDHSTTESHNLPSKAATVIAPASTTSIRSTVTFATVVLSMITMIVVLLIENFLIWVVSATFIPGHVAATAPPPLQDNGQLVLKYVFHTVFQLPSKTMIVSLRRLLNTQWALVACVGTSFVVTELYDPRRTLYGIANRALMTIAVARFIRTISFMLTVVPSQNRYCYIQRGFPYPPPQQIMEWIWIGIIPRSHGGCNDLIISGHATIISTLACISTSISNDSIFGVALWSMVVMDFMVEIYEGFHYSVDMWLGIVLVTLLWNVLQSFEGLPPVPLVPSADISGRSQQQQEALTMRSYMAYIAPGLVAYLQLIVVTQDIANIVIVLFVVSAVFVYVQVASKTGTNSYLRKWYIHYAQHILLCLVFMALGIYL